MIQALARQQEVPLTAEVAAHVRSLWADPGVKRIFFEHRSKFQIPDSADYFFDNVMRVADEKYVPTYHDGITPPPLLHYHADQSMVV
jgi:hypothetical protein